MTSHVAMRPGKRNTFKQAGDMGKLLHKAENFKAGIRSNVVHPFRVLKSQFGDMQTCYWRLKKNARKSTPYLRCSICGWLAMI
jgi:IS5 family transposase